MPFGRLGILFRSVHQALLECVDTVVEHALAPCAGEFPLNSFGKYGFPRNGVGVQRSADAQRKQVGSRLDLGDGHHIIEWRYGGHAWSLIE